MRNPISLKFNCSLAHPLYVGRYRGEIRIVVNVATGPAKQIIVKKMLLDQPQSLRELPHVARPLHALENEHADCRASGCRKSPYHERGTGPKEWAVLKV